MGRPLFSSTRADIWRANDTPWTLCARNLLLSGYPDVPTLYDDFLVANPRVLFWSRLQAGSTVQVPALPKGTVR